MRQQAAESQHQHQGSDYSILQGDFSMVHYSIFLINF